MDEKTIWGIHGGKTGDAESLMLNKKVMAIGWKDFGGFSGLESREAFKEKYAEVYPSKGSRHIATCAGQLFRFLHEVQVGDIVVFPVRRDRQVHIGEIVGEYKYQPAVDENYPNHRAVKWLKQLPRTSFSQGSLYEMGSAMSLFQIKSYADEVIALLEGKESETTNVDDTVALVAEDIENQTRDFVLKQLERNLKGLPLEDFVKHLLETMGYNARLTRPNEPSVDVIAYKDQLGLEPPIIKVQVKSSPGKISDRDVSALYGKVEGQEVGLMITLGDFTEPAWRFANGKANLRLINGDELVDLIFQYYDTFDNQYKSIIPLKQVYIPQALDSNE